MTDGLTSRINLRVKPSERDRLQLEAKDAGLSMSEMVRRQYFRLRIISKTDLHMINELRRIGGLLKHTLVETKGENANEVAEALREVTRAIQRISSPDSR